MYLSAVPSFGSNFFDGRFEHRQAEKVHVSILLLVMLLITLGKLKAV